MRTGIVSAALAFFLWGVFPLYFHALAAIAPTEILAHRVLWSLIFLAVVLAVRGQWGWLGALRGQPRVIASFAASAVLLSANWLLYIWAVNSGHVIEGSLGYFINPLFNVMLGYLVLKERLRPLQWAAIGIAGAGVLWLTWQAGHMPWIALLLFAHGARRIPLSVLGLLQYIGPTLQLALGVYVFHEAFTPARLAGFALIWTALALYAGEGMLRSRRAMPA